MLYFPIAGWSFSNHSVATYNRIDEFRSLVQLHDFPNKGTAVMLIRDNPIKDDLIRDDLSRGGIVFTQIVEHVVK